MSRRGPASPPNHDGHSAAEGPDARARRAAGRWLANAGYAALLVVLALVPSSSLDIGRSVPDWAAHAVAYGLQAGLITWASLPALGRRRALVAGVSGATAFGAVTELLQLLQPRRSVEPADLVANAVGALVACGIIAAVGRSANRGDR